MSPTDQELLAMRDSYEARIENLEHVIELERSAWVKRNDDANKYLIRAKVAERECKRLGDELAREYAKPGGSWDAADREQLMAEVERLETEVKWERSRAVSAETRLIHATRPKEGR